MSIIAYFKDALYADRQVLKDGGGVKRRYQNKPKLFLSDCGTFAYCVAGAVLVSDEDDTMEKLILTQILKAQDTKAFVRNATDKDMGVIYNAFGKLVKFLERTNTVIIAMTCDTVFYIDNKGAEFIEPDDFCCAGSSAHVFTALMHEDPVTIPVAFEIMSNIEPTVGQTFDCIKRSDLIPVKNVWSK